MSPTTVAAEGTAEVAAGFDELGRFVDDLTETHRAVVSKLVPAIRAGTPRRTGALAVAWSTGAEKSGGSILNPLPYAWPIESGVTGRFEGFHMVRDVLASSTDDLNAGYEDAIASKAKSIGFEVDR